MICESRYESAISHLEHDIIEACFLGSDLIIGSVDAESQSYEAATAASAHSGNRLAEQLAAALDTALDLIPIAFVDIRTRSASIMVLLAQRLQNDPESSCTRRRASDGASSRQSFAQISEAMVSRTTVVGIIPAINNGLQIFDLGI